MRSSRNNLKAYFNESRKNESKYFFWSFRSWRTKIIFLILIQTFLILTFFSNRVPKLFKIKSNSISFSSFSSSSSSSKFNRFIRGNFGEQTESLETIISQIRKEKEIEDNLRRKSDWNSNFSEQETKPTSRFHQHGIKSQLEAIQSRRLDWIRQIKKSLGENDAKDYKIGKTSSKFTSASSNKVKNDDEDKWGGKEKQTFMMIWKSNHPWPPRNTLSMKLERINSHPPRNQNLFPNLSKNRIIFVLYVHNRPSYLKIVLNSLSKVTGINETLLIVSHDGKYKAMDALVKEIKFCQVKQIYAPYSPHNFQKAFPHTSPNDCKGKKGQRPKEEKEMPCEGRHDTYLNYRDPHYISLKHHWWWMMNTVWDGLEETRHYDGNIVFIEEDHFVFPNAYAHLLLLLKHKDRVCPHCIAVNLAPSRVTSKGEFFKSFISEKMGNVGYSFNRTIWNAIHAEAYKFCNFDDYNWDLTLWQNIFEFWKHHFSLRWSRTSAVHIGKCGLHIGKKLSNCNSNGVLLPRLEPQDHVVNINESMSLRHIPYKNFPKKFKGFGGWGDWRDQELCKFFANMYRKLEL